VTQALLNIVLPGPDASWHVVFRGVLQSDVYGSQKLAQQRLTNLQSGRPHAMSHPIAFRQYSRTWQGWEHHSKTLSAATFDHHTSPRLLIDAFCTVCGEFPGDDLKANLQVPAALRHAADTGHVIVLNGTADLPLKSA